MPPQAFLVVQSAAGVVQNESPAGKPKGKKIVEARYMLPVQR